MHGEELEGDTLIATYSREIYEGQVRQFRLAYQNIVVFTQNVFLKDVQYHITRMMENTWGQLHIVFVEEVGYIFWFDIIRNTKTVANTPGYSMNKQGDNRIWKPTPNAPVQFLAIFLSEDYLKDVWGWTVEDSSFNNKAPASDNEQSFAPITDSQSIQILDRIFDKSALSNTSSPIKEHLADAIHRVLGSHVFYHENSNNDVLKNLKNAEAALLKDFRNAPTLISLSKIAGMNRVKFQKLFTEQYGCTFYQYYQKKRFEYAKKLIERMGYTVSDAAYVIGYKHLGHFSREFAKINGIKPSELKKTNGL